VSTSSDYRSFAEECMGWARTAKSNRERQIFVRMAETWFAAALLAGEREGSGTSISAPDPESGDAVATSMAAGRKK
jgi:hypothetical protein